MEKDMLKKILFLLIIINPVLSLCFDNTNIRYHYLFLPLIYILSLIITRKNNKDFSKLLIASILTFISVLVSVLCGSHLGKINNHLFNFLTFISLCVLFSNNKIIMDFKKYLLDRKWIVFIILIIINIVELYVFITKQGLYYRYSWGGTFFKGTSSMPHTLSYLMLTTIIYSIVMFLISKEKKYLIFSLLPYFFIFESGARVSLILAGILGLFELDITILSKDKSKLVKFGKLLIILAIFIIIFKDKIMESSIMTKILKRTSSSDMSAGRTTLWGDLLYRYITNPIKWAFGFGDDKVYYYSGINKTIGESIWAHNDFVQVLFGKGIAGIVSYFIGLITFIKTNFKNNGNYCTILIIVFFFIAATLNGFYTYRDLMIAIPFIYLLNIYLNSKKQVGELVND